MSVYIAAAAYADVEMHDGGFLARELRRADDFIRYGALAILALQRRLPGKTGQFEDHCGLFLGTAHGPMTTTFRVLDQMLAEDPVSPTLFSQSLFNAAAGQLAQIFRLLGPAFTVTDFAFPFFQSLQQACCALESGAVSTCLVLQVESYSPLLVDAGSKDDPAAAPLPPGACALLLAGRPASSKSWHIDKFRLNLQQASPHTLLHEHESMTINDATYHRGSLGNCRQLIDCIVSSKISGLDVRLQAEYGEVELRLSL